MTKAKELALPEAPEQTEEDKLYDRARAEKREADWQRETALQHALTLHKNNGGMMLAEQAVANAQVFLKFLKGEAQ